MNKKNLFSNAEIEKENLKKNKRTFLLFNYSFESII